MANLGFATVSVIPVLKGGMSSLAGDIDSASEEGSKKAGGTLITALGKAGKVGAIAAGTAIVGGIGKAMTSGWGRLVAIEEAEARMRGLGFEAKTVESVMNSANESVLGTSFTLAEAAGVAAMAVTAGIKPGQQLDQVLGTIANSAAAAGTDMGSMGAIFNNVATTNRAYMDTLNQVAHRGIPIYQALADQFGVTAEDVRKMASDGQIDFATFSAAMQDATGTMADELGNTVPGAIDLFTASLGRLGEAALGPIYSALQSALLGARDGINQLTAAVGPASQGFMDFVSGGLSYAAAALQPVWQAIQTQLLPALQRLWDIISPVLIPVLKVLGDLLLGVVKGAFDGVVMVITGVVDVLTGLANFISSVFTGNWSAAWEAVKQVVGGALTAIFGAIQVWANVTILGAIRGGIAKLISAFTGGWNGIRNIFTTALNGIRALVTTVWNAIVGFFRSGMTTASGIATNGLAVLRSAFGGAFAAIRTVVSQAWAAISGFFRTGASTMLSVMRSGLSSLSSAVSSGITGVINFFRQVPSRIRSALGNVGSLLVGSGKQLLAGFVSGITSGFSNALGAVKNGLSRIRNFFPFSPAKEGPFAGSGYVDRSGLALMTDFAAGLSQGGVAAVRNARNVISDVQRQFSAQAGTSRLAVAGAGGLAAAGGITIQQHITYPVAEPASVATKAALDHAAALGLVG